MIHCSHCKSEILHGATFMRYCGFAYCSSNCLYQYSIQPKNHVWYDYVHEIGADSDNYDSEYADVEALESQLARTIENIVGMMSSCKICTN